MKKKMNKYMPLLLCLLILTMSCTAPQKKSNSTIFKSAYKAATVNKATVTGLTELDETVDNDTSKQITIEEVPNFLSLESSSVNISGLDNNLNMDVMLPKGDVKVSVDELPVKAFISSVFGEILKQDYSIDKAAQKINDKITLKMTHGISSKEFLVTVVDILRKYQIKTSVKDGIFHFSKSSKKYRSEREYPLLVIGRKPIQMANPQVMISQIFPVYYVNASNIFATVKELALSQDGRIQNVPGTQAVVITDRLVNVQNALQIVEMLDRPFLEDKMVSLYYLEHVSGENFIDEIKKILPESGTPVSIRKGAPGLVFVDIKSINAVMAVSPKKEWLRAVDYWKDKIDTLSADATEKKKLYVFHPKHRDAESLLDIFNGVSSNTGSTGSSNKSDSKFKDFSKKAQEKSKDSKKTVKATTSVKGGLVSGDFNILLDDAQNTLLIFAYPTEYRNIYNVLKRLDVMSKQVLVEVTFADVTLTDSLKYGVEWYLKQSAKLSGALQTMGNLGIGGSGLVYSAATSGNKIQTLLNASATKNLINIISTPHLLVLDNQEATINVGSEIPVVTSEVQAAGDGNDEPTLTKSVQYRSTGVNLTVKPVVNADDLLTLDITLDISDTSSAETSSTDSPIIITRNLSTSVMLKSGGTILLGGLISSNDSEIVNKVPLLGDIPILGHLFKTTSKGLTKTELIMQITPYVISGAAEMQEITKNVKKQLDLIDRDF